MRRIFDKYGFEGFYSGFTIGYDVSAMGFYFLSLKKAVDYDIIHVHSIDKLVPPLKIYHRKPVVLHYHGTDIRGRGNLLAKKIYKSLSNRVLVSTPDLLMDIPSAIYMPNPVDTDIFKPINGLKRKNTALFFLKYPDDDNVLKRVRKIGWERGLKLQIFNRRFEGEMIPYTNLPLLYNKYEYFIDRIRLNTLSKMALEALACGLKVVKDDRVILGLPEQHLPFQVIARLMNIYEDIS
jgi:hypothetical protein